MRNSGVILRRVVEGLSMEEKEISKVISGCVERVDTCRACRGRDEMKKVDELRKLASEVG